MPTLPFISLPLGLLPMTPMAKPCTMDYFSHSKRLFIQSNKSETGIIWRYFYSKYLTSTFRNNIGS